MSKVLATLSLLALVKGQQAGDLEDETHPTMSWSTCTGSGSCTSVDGEVVIDANWRWFHDDAGTNCYDGNEWTDVCSTNVECAEVCAAEGVKYEETYGVSTSGDALTLTFVTEHEYGTNVGSRMYLMESEDMYQTFDLLGNEFAFDVDLSTVGCGLNSALYFVPMPADGGVSDTNTAGAKYGTGYCDSQCARDLKFIDGEGNIEGWEGSSSDDQAGVGGRGACCAEIDIWESNSEAFAFTPHACENNEFHVCVAPDCGGTYSDDRYAGDCDANGCDYNPYRMGNTDFYGPGKQVDTGSPFTVVTQFDADGTGRQFFVQDGARIDPPAPTWEGIPASAEINEEFCSSIFAAFDDYDRFAEVGGWSALQDALSQPMVLVMSIWADHYANMLWLDGVWPRDGDASAPGKTRGPCAADSGVPSEVIAEQPDSYVTWSNIRYGPIGSTTGL